MSILFDSNYKFTVARLLMARQDGGIDLSRGEHFKINQIYSGKIQFFLIKNIYIYIYRIHNRII